MQIVPYNKNRRYWINFKKTKKKNPYNYIMALGLCNNYLQQMKFLFTLMRNILANSTFSLPKWASLLKCASLLKIPTYQKWKTQCNKCKLSQLLQQDARHAQKQTSKHLRTWPWHPFATLMDRWVKMGVLSLFTTLASPKTLLHSHNHRQMDNSHLLQINYRIVPNFCKLAKG